MEPGRRLVDVTFVLALIALGWLTLSTIPRLEDRVRAAETPKEAPTPKVGACDVLGGAVDRHSAHIRTLIESVAAARVEIKDLTAELKELETKRFSIVNVEKAKLR